VYEQTQPHTPFGKQMVSNLQLRGCPLLGIHDYPSRDSQVPRYKSLGWGSVDSWTMNQVFNRWCFADQAEFKRVVRLELLDEVEEFQLIQDHYMVLVATSREALDQPELSDGM